MAEPAAIDTETESERLDIAADQAISACGGDLRSAVRALILANEYLESELSHLCKAVSKGYSRGRTQKVDNSQSTLWSEPDA